MSADTIVTWIGLALAILGIAITLWQLQKTKSAAEAARDAVRLSEARIAGNLLLVALPRLLDLETQLVRAIADDRRLDIALTLIEWRNAAADAHALLRRRPTSGVLRSSLARAIPVVGEACDYVRENLQLPEPLNLRLALRAISVATTLVAAELAERKVYDDGDVRA